MFIGRDIAQGLPEPDLFISGNFLLAGERQEMEIRSRPTRLCTSAALFTFEPRDRLQAVHTFPRERFSAHQSIVEITLKTDQTLTEFPNEASRRR